MIKCKLFLLRVKGDEVFSPTIFLRFFATSSNNCINILFSSIFLQHFAWISAGPILWECLKKPCDLATFDNSGLLLTK